MTWTTAVSISSASSRRRPVDGGSRVPLAGRGLGVEPGGELGPYFLALVEVGSDQGRGARLDQRPAGRQAPGGGGPLDDRVRARRPARRPSAGDRQRRPG